MRPADLGRSIDFRTWLAASTSRVPPATPADGLLPNPGNVTRDCYRRRSLLGGGPMFRLVVDGVPAPQVQIRAAYHVDSGTDRGFGCLGSVWSIRM
jgi:hypothetical protein